LYLSINNDAIDLPLPLEVSCLHHYHFPYLVCYYCLSACRCPWSEWICRRYEL